MFIAVRDGVAVRHMGSHLRQTYAGYSRSGEEKFRSHVLEKGGILGEQVLVFRKRTNVRFWIQEEEREKVVKI